MRLNAIEGKTAECGTYPAKPHTNTRDENQTSVFYHLFKQYASTFAAIGHIY